MYGRVVAIVHICVDCRVVQDLQRADQQVDLPLTRRTYTFVDFGNKANNFLRACGVKNEPNIQEIADLLVQDPKRFLELAGGPLV